MSSERTILTRSGNGSFNARASAAAMASAARLITVVFGDRHPNAQGPITCFRLANEVVDCLRHETGKRAKKCPLIPVRKKIVIHEYAVAVIACTPLKRQCDEIAKTALRQGVLAGEHSIVGSNPTSGRRCSVSVNKVAPNRRASLAGIGCEKKIQTWPPLPDRDRSSAAGTELKRHVSK